MAKTVFPVSRLGRMVDPDHHDDGGKGVNDGIDQGGEQAHRARLEISDQLGTDQDHGGGDAGIGRPFSKTDFMIEPVSILFGEVGTGH